ncbi:hypothetical protein Fot_56979 [Forsythia ovata]|uniref:Uncharacterized protein n=1 Tax=Forsythia ovata TaxID=205694 RepID=A0ABD1NXA4_9LAMI
MLSPSLSHSLYNLINFKTSMLSMVKEETRGKKKLSVEANKISSLLNECKIPVINAKTRKYKTCSRGIADWSGGLVGNSDQLVSGPMVATWHGVKGEVVKGFNRSSPIGDNARSTGCNCTHLSLHRSSTTYFEVEKI